MNMNGALSRKFTSNVASWKLQESSQKHGGTTLTIPLLLTQPFGPFQPKNARHGQPHLATASRSVRSVSRHPPPRCGGEDVLPKGAGRAAARGAD